MYNITLQLIQNINVKYIALALFLLFAIASNDDYTDATSIQQIAE